jgi:hypothetical protein
MLPSAQRIFDAARFVVALGADATSTHVDRLRQLVERTPSAAAEAYAYCTQEPDGFRHDDVARTIAATAAALGLRVA